VRSCRVVVVTKSAVQSPLLPFQRGVVLVQSFNAVLFSAAVCSHAVTLLGSNVKDQPPYFEISFIYGGESQFWLGHPQFRVASQHAFFELFGLFMSLWSTLLIGRDSFLLSVEIFKVSFRILKVLCDKSFLFLSHNALSLFVYPSI